MLFLDVSALFWLLSLRSESFGLQCGGVWPWRRLPLLRVAAPAPVAVVLASTAGAFPPVPVARLLLLLLRAPVRIVLSVPCLALFEWYTVPISTSNCGPV